MARKASTSFTLDLALLDRLDRVVERVPNLKKTHVVERGLQRELDRIEREIDAQRKVALDRALAMAGAEKGS